MKISIINAENKNPEYEKLITFLGRWNFNYEELPDEELSKPEVKHRTQQTMTKEETAVEFIIEMIDNMVLNGGDLGEDLPALLVHIKRAKEIEQQQLYKEREKAKKLVKALKKTLRVIEDYEGELSLGYIFAKQSLTEYEKL